MTKPRPPVFKVGDVVMFREALVGGDHPWHAGLFRDNDGAEKLRPGDIGVVTRVDLKTPSIHDNAWAYSVEWGRVGHVGRTWGAPRLDLVEAADET